VPFLQTKMTSQHLCLYGSSTKSISWYKDPIYGAIYLDAICAAIVHSLTNSAGRSSLTRTEVIAYQAAVSMCFFLTHRADIEAIARQTVVWVSLVLTCLAGLEMVAHQTVPLV
jgi:hypothetical protein